MSASQMEPPLAGEPAEKKPSLIHVGLAYVYSGRLQFGALVQVDYSGPQPGYQKLVYRAAREFHRGRRLDAAEVAAGAKVPRDAAEAFVRGMWFCWRGRRWRPFLTDDNLAAVLTWLGLPDPLPADDYERFEAAISELTYRGEDDPDPLRAAEAARRLMGAM